MGIPPIGMCSAPCGAGLCGADIPSLSAAIAPMKNAAAYTVAFGNSRIIPLNADGTAQELHPVDQEVIFDLSNQLGTIAADPTRGLDIQAIRDAEDARKPQTAIDRVNVCLAVPIANGDVEILDVSLQSNPPLGQIGLSVTYRNLRLHAQAAPTPPTIRL